MEDLRAELADLVGGRAVELVTVGALHPLDGDFTARPRARAGRGPICGANAQKPRLLRMSEVPPLRQRG